MHRVEFGRYKDWPGIGQLLAMCTLCIAYFLFYERYCNRTYYNNRKNLIILLKTSGLKLKDMSLITFHNENNKRVVEYVFEHKDTIYQLWHYINTDAIFMDVRDGVAHPLIGTYNASFEAKLQSKKIARLLRRNYPSAYKDFQKADELLLQEAIEKEDYEHAAVIRDRMKKETNH